MKKSELQAENIDLRRRVVALEKALREQEAKSKGLEKRINNLETLMFQEIESDPIADLARALTGVVAAAKQRVLND